MSGGAGRIFSDIVKTREQELPGSEKNGNFKNILLTLRLRSANILFARYKKRVQDTERYRSGHNEAVLKTVCPNGHMGSNPILSAPLLLCK